MRRMADAAAQLTRHPASPGAGVRSVATEIALDAAGGLRLSYRVDGTTDRVRWPVATNPGRADGLWQHSCFEVFLRGDERPSYLEFNFSPSGAWAAYRFAGRRSGVEAPDMPPPRIGFRLAPGLAEMTVELAPAALAGILDAATIHAGLAVVLEDELGRLSHWALAHGGEAPDFHDPAAFGIALPAR